MDWFWFLGSPQIDSTNSFDLKASFFQAVPVSLLLTTMVRAGAGVPPVSRLDVTTITFLSRYLSKAGLPKKCKNIPKSHICTMSLKMTKNACFPFIPSKRCACLQKGLCWRFEGGPGVVENCHSTQWSIDLMHGKFLSMDVDNIYKLVAETNKLVDISKNHWTNVGMTGWIWNNWFLRNVLSG